MAVRNFNRDNVVGSDAQPVATATGLAQGDTTNVIQLPQGLSAVRVYATGAGAFTLTILAGPVANVNSLVAIGTVTNATPSVVFPGPVGNILRLDATAAANPLSVGVMGLKGN